MASELIACGFVSLLAVIGAGALAVETYALVGLFDPAAALALRIIGN